MAKKKTIKSKVTNKAPRKKPSKPAAVKKKVARTKKTASDSASAFSGRIVRVPVDAQIAVSGLKAPRAILFPKTRADVAAAVTLSQNEKVLIRSGTQAAAVTDAPDAAGAVVINLAELSKVGIAAGTMKAEVAATAGDLAGHLAEHGFALPLGNNPDQSIAANLIHEGPSCLMRTLGPLSQYVSSLNVVSPAGKPMTLSSPSAVVRSRDRSAVITQVNFKPAPTKNLWMFRVSFPYPGKEQFTALIRALLVQKKIPTKSDLILDAFSARYDLPFIRITAAGSDKKDRTSLTKLVDKALAGLPPEFANEIVREKFTDSAVIQAITDADLAFHATRKLTPIESARLLGQKRIWMAS